MYQSQLLARRLSAAGAPTADAVRCFHRYLRRQSYIDGKWTEASATFPVVNPASGQLLGEAPECSEQDLQAAVQAAGRAFPRWSQTTARQRSAALRRLFDLQTREQEPLARLITAEMGKPIAESRGEIAYGASFVEWFAEQAKRIHGEVLQSPWPEKTLTYTKEPIGPVAIITPVGAAGCEFFRVANQNELKSYSNQEIPISFHASGTSRTR